MDDKDYVFKIPSMEDYIKSRKVKEFVPDLDVIYLPEGTRFVQEQSPDEVDQLILTFLNASIRSLIFVAKASVGFDAATLAHWNPILIPLCVLLSMQKRINARPLLSASSLWHVLYVFEYVKK